MRVGITGVLGVVGSQLAKRFAEDGIETSGLDNRAQPSEQQGDICNLDDIRKAFKTVMGLSIWLVLLLHQGKSLILI